MTLMKSLTFERTQQAPLSQEKKGPEEKERELRELGRKLTSGVRL